MISSSRPVIVGVDGAPESELAVRWGAREAVSLRVPLTLLHSHSYAAMYGAMGAYAFPAETNPALDRAGAQDIVDEAVKRQRAAHPDGPETTGLVVENSRAGGLLEASAEASVVVVGSRHLGVIGAALIGSTGAAVAAQATCPVVVVRRAGGDPAAGAPVVVGVDLSDLSEPTLSYALEHASRYGTPLRAILSWYPGHHLLTRWTDADAEAFRTRGLLMLAEALAGWQEKYPDVQVERELSYLHPVDALITGSLDAHLLVVGAQGRHARVGSLLGSVSQGVLHHATCPVAVVHRAD